MEPATIVIVENNDDVAELLGELLTLAGYHVVICTDGACAHARVVAVQPRLVILDNCLPGAYGTNVYHALRADGATAAVPVIFFTGAGTQLPVDVPVVPKPYFQELLELVEQTVGLHFHA